MAYFMFAQFASCVICRKIRATKLSHTGCTVAARLILTQLKLHDLFDVEMKRLQQQKLNYDGGSVLSPVSVCSASQLPSTHVATISSSQPFELPDINISNLLSLTAESPKNTRSSLIDNQRTLSTSLSVSSRQPSRNDSSADKKVDKNCRQNDVRNADMSRTASSNELSVAATVMSSDSRKRPANRQCTSAQDSDDEFEDLHCNNIAKKRTEERQYVESKADDRSVAAEESIHKSAVESSSKQDNLAVVADVPNRPASIASRECSAVSNSLAVDSSSAQQKMAQRLSKFAFNDSFLWQRQELSTAGIRSQGLQSTQHCTGNCCILSLFARLFMCIHCTRISLMLIFGFESCDYVAYL